jgi:hypothetical protein
MIPRNHIDDPTIINRRRLLTNADLASADPQCAAWYREIHVDATHFTVDLRSGRLLIIDPIYLADVYNKDGPKEGYLKEHGVILSDFGGDVSGPVFRTRCGGLKVVLCFDRADAQGNPIFRCESSDELRPSEVDSHNLAAIAAVTFFSTTAEHFAPNSGRSWLETVS